VKRLPIVAFVGLAIATIAAFFIVQALKVTTPLLAGFPAPHPAAINPVSGGTCTLKGGRPPKPVPTSFRSMSISFYLQRQADNVTVRIVKGDGTFVDTLATGRHMNPHQRLTYTWNGKRADGTVATAGNYYIQVTLIHQKRTFLIAKASTGVAEPVRVQTEPTPIRVTAVRADHGSLPAVMPQSSGRPVAVHFTVIGHVRPTVRIYRTDVPGKPVLVNSFRARSLHTAFWNGTASNGSPAPQGTYLAAVTGVDSTCTRSTFPTKLPPTPGSTAHAGITVRYLAAQPPMTASAPGTTATVFVDSRRHPYTWSLHRIGSSATLRSGHSPATVPSLKVPLPGGDDGLYLLSLHYGSHRTSVPLVTGVTGASKGAGHGILVVLPSLSWQGYNPVDDNDDGVPNTLVSGGPVGLERTLAHGLPAGFAGEAGLISYLGRAGLSYSLTTDLSLIDGGQPLLRGYSGVAFVGTERWLPASTGAALNTYVEHGGHVFSVGIGAFQRDVTVSSPSGPDSSATNPTPPHAIDDLEARPGRVEAAGGSLVLVDQNHQGLFGATAKAISGFKRLQIFGPVAAPAKLLTSAGIAPSSPSVIGYSLGNGAVVDVGLVGFGQKVGSNVNAQELIRRVWTFLGR
jgi:flagellar hook assembly protein FlgD